MKKKLLKKWSSILLICTMISLLLTVTVGWIDALIKTGLQGTNVQVGTASGLIMTFDGKIATDTISINDFINDNISSDFLLKEVSSETGVSNFFVRDDNRSDVIDGEEIIYFLNATANVDYIELTFDISNNNDDTVDVVFDDESYIGLDETFNTDAIRVSLEIKESNETGAGTESIIIFGTYAETGSEGFTESSPDTDGFYNTITVTSLDEDGTALTTSNQTVRTISSYDTNQTTNKLFTLTKSQEKTVTVRIWLEGGSYACTNIGANDISGELFDLSLIFTILGLEEDSAST